jgi:hypothetical protein
MSEALFYSSSHEDTKTQSGFVFDLLHVFVSSCELINAPFGGERDL